jgi:hypothetical protein
MLPNIAPHNSEFTSFSKLALREVPSGLHEMSDAVFASKFAFLFTHNISRLSHMRR